MNKPTTGDFSKTPGWLDWYDGPSRPRFQVPPGSVCQPVRSWPLKRAVNGESPGSAAVTAMVATRLAASIPSGTDKRGDWTNIDGIPRGETAEG